MKRMPSAPSTARAVTTRAVRPRDPEKTRARILKAAIADFSARGYSGARTARIARNARVSIRMLYHYFGGKDALYVVVLEEVLGQLRRAELRLEVEDVEPVEGLLRAFDFLDDHFAAHPELRCLLAFENLNRAQHLKRSSRIPAMASPVLRQVDRLLRRGEADGSVRPGVDALQLYVAMAALAYYGKSHAFTLSRMFATELLAPAWQAGLRAQTRAMLAAYLRPAA